MSARIHMFKVVISDTDTVTMIVLYNKEVIHSKKRKIVTNFPHFHMTDRICDKIKLSEIYDRKGVFTHTGERKRREIVMKKKVVGMLLCCVLVVSLAGCGKGQESAETKGEKTTELGDAEKAETTKENDRTASSSDALGGVYPDGEELTSIPMGTCIDGEQVDLVNVEMPLNYIFGAGFVKEDGESESFDKASGNSTLASSLEDDFQNQSYAINVAETVAFGESGTSVRYLVATNYTFDDMKEKAKTGENFSDYTEKTINGTDVIYYKNNSQPISTDFIMIYPIKDVAILGVYYNGSLADELSMDQLAENICNLITVIE